MLKFMGVDLVPVVLELRFKLDLETKAAELKVCQEQNIFSKNYPEE